jgi:hypothetical protein
MNASSTSILGFLTLLTLALAVPSAGAKDVHQVAGKVRCLECHSRLPWNESRPSFQDEVGSTCVGCHNDFHGRGKGLAHPVNAIPSMVVPRDMPLDSKGRMNCITCHAFHRGYKDADGNKLFFLRRSSGKAFCYSCHKKPLH